MTRPALSRPSPTRILIVADNASALFGGEAILPLKYFTLLAERGRDVHLITHARNRDPLSAALPDLAGRITYTPDTALHRWLWRRGAPMPSAIRDHLISNLIGLLTGWQQRRAARALIGPDTVVHQPIPVSPSAPSLLYGLGAPVVIGPMNGGMNYPPGYEDFEGRASRLFVRLGRPLARLINRAIPGKRRAAMLLVANARSRDALPPSPAPVQVLPENAVDLRLFPAPDGPRPPRDPARLELVYMGRLIPLKALDVTLHALARARADCPDVAISLRVLGDGPDRGQLETLTHDLGLQDCVTFLGFRPQAECAALLRDADALILASLRECGGAVVLEAMAMGLAVIASDWGGPRDYVTPATGILVPPSPRAGFDARLAEAIARLARDPALTRALGAAGAERVAAEFDWQHRIDQIEAIYEQVRPTKPSS